MVKKNLAVLLIIFTAAFGIRLWFLAQLQNDLVFHIPVSDPKEFNLIALMILRHGWAWLSLPNSDLPQYHTPLYPYFIAVIYKIFGFHLSAVAVIQSLLGSLSACLIFLLTLDLAGPGAAIMASIFMIFYWFLIYTQLFLFSECLAMTINIIMVYYLTVAKESLKKYFSGGLLLGASLLCRPDLGLFAGLIFFWIWGKNKDRQRAVIYYGTFLLTTVLMLVPLLVRNHEISGSWTLRSQVGANIYLGNDPESYGSNIFVEQGRLWQKFMSMPYLELRPDRELTEKELNDFYIRKISAKIKDHPMAWGSLILKKAWSLITGREFLRAEDVYFRDQFISPYLLQYLSTPLIFVLFIPGFFIAWKSRERHQLLILILLSSIPSIFFPAKTRYLVPIIPFVIFYASFFVSAAYQAIGDQDQSRSIKLICGFLICVLASFYNPLNLREPDVSETYYALASNLHYLKSYDLARQSYISAVELNPQNSMAWNDLSALYFAQKDYPHALDSLSKAAAVDDYYAQKYEYAQDVITQGRPIPLSFTAMDGEDLDDLKAYNRIFRYSTSSLNKLTPPIYGSS